jgi:predicted nucleic acid-binding protein
VIAFADTSFLCALYVAQDDSAVALAHYRRLKDPLHVATALHVGASEFLSFDVNQRKLAAVEGLATRP